MLPAGWRDFKVARKSFFGGVSGFDFRVAGERGVSFANRDPEIVGFVAVVVGGPFGVCGSTLRGAASSVAPSLSAGIDGSVVAMGFGFGDGGTDLSSSKASAPSFFAVSDFSRRLCKLCNGFIIFWSDGGSALFEGDSDLERKLTGLNCTSLIGDDLPEAVEKSAGGLCNGLTLPKSTLPRCCFIRLSSLIHAGCCGGACCGFGDSGLFSALSNQLDFVGLQRLEGLGGDVSSCGGWPSLKVDAIDLLRLWRGIAGLTNSGFCGLSAASLVVLAGPALELGRDEGSCEFSWLRALGLGLGTGSVPYMLALLLKVELCRLKLGGAWVLHLLLTLSLRFIMAL